MFIWEFYAIDLAFFGCLAIVGYFIVDYIKGKQKAKKEKQKLEQGW